MQADGRESASRRGYDTKWRKARDQYLARHPLCVMCQQIGRTTAATVVDHIVPHKGDMALFWARSNWQSLCKACHDKDKQSIDRGGMRSGCGVDGVPHDASHHWR